MKHTIKFAIAVLPLFALAAPACDSPDDEAELAALDIEDEVLAQAKTNHKPAVEEFDLEANMTPMEAPPGKCCKAICSWQQGVWHQLWAPYDKADNCNANANWWCKNAGYGPGPDYSHAEDAQWRTCGS